MRNLYDLVPVLRDIGRAFTKYARIDRMSFDFGMGTEYHPAEVHLVSTVSGLGQAGVTQIAAEAGVTKGAVSQMVGKLVGKGLLEKRPDPDNGARVIISVTESGERLERSHREFHLSHDREFIDYLAGLNEDEFRTVAELCERMDKWMDNYLE